jgi:uncharacterized protein (TIGR00297 family)
VTSIRRAAAYAVVATLSLAAPVLGLAAAIPFGLVAVAAFATTEGPAFELFARAPDRQTGRLTSLASFALAVAGFALLTPAFGMPVGVFVATVVLVGYGNVGAAALTTWRSGNVYAAAGFVAVGTAAAVGGQLGAAALLGDSPSVTALALFLAASGALLAALLRAVFVGREDPLVVLSVGLVLWMVADLAGAPAWTPVLIALGVSAGFGYLSWALDTASVPGMLTGVLLGLIVGVLGGPAWLAVLMAFFAIGGLSSKYRYEEKLERGVAEPEGGARGSGNVLANAAPALVAVLLFAAADSLTVGPAPFRFAFLGSLATALADTLSSEIGGLYDGPRLVTTLRRVEPGTDGAVTWQGELAGLAGATLVGGLTVGLFSVDVVVGGLVALAGVVGMTVDSVLGATVEGERVGNQVVNAIATASGAVAGGALVAGLA